MISKDKTHEKLQATDPNTDIKRVTYKFPKGRNSCESFQLYEWLKPTKIIAKGAYSVLCQATDLRNLYYDTKYAVKKSLDVFSSTVDARTTLKEIKLLRHFDHPNIIALYNVVPPLSQKRDDYRDIYTIMPKYDATLSKIIRSKQKLTARHIKYFTYQIARALEYIHSANIVHSDLRPENILVKAANCKLVITDFKSSQFTDGTHLYMLESGSLTDSYPIHRWYKAPEVLCCSRSAPSNPKSDIWALGCIVAELYIRTPFLKGRNHVEQLKLMFYYLGTPTDLSWVEFADAKKWIEGNDFKTGMGLAEALPDSTKSDQEFIKTLLILNPNNRADASSVVSSEWLKELWRESDYSVCSKFNISEENYGNMVKTSFGVRYLLSEELNNFNREVIKKEAIEREYFLRFYKVVIQQYCRLCNVNRQQSIDLILLIMTQYDYIGSCYGLLQYVQKKLLLMEKYCHRRKQSVK